MSLAFAFGLGGSQRGAVDGLAQVNLERVGILLNFERVDLLLDFERVDLLVNFKRVGLLVNFERVDLLVGFVSLGLAVFLVVLILALLDFLSFLFFLLLQIVEVFFERPSLGQQQLEVALANEHRMYLWRYVHRLVFLKDGAVVCHLVEILEPFDHQQAQLTKVHLL